MPQPKLKVELKLFSPEAKIPEYKTPGAAAFDLHACIPDEESVLVAPHEVLSIPTGVGIYLKNPDYCLEIWERSGMGSAGIGRRAGLVDPDYQGQILVLIQNHTEDWIIIKHGERIAQAKVAPVQRATFDLVDEFSDVTERGAKGFGSTGKG